ncbi:MAG TPA: aminoacyl-tRNA hydrolase [Candidatus Corynebacterium gallistercoris]|uniref:Peptidyl-tRNA hydrolase n=1 Tax=Candidatus Corynebacterium gallistercoris TaxID=2838530 RepID=A0A9D1RWK9_9CORY|nr:aminoacyl-tRNA hydrolase [Candidatus Corynebacterium gallistercoris]
MEWDAQWLIIGLGNPGPKYAATRHNIGYMAIDALLDREGARLEPVKGMPALVARVEIDGVPVMVARSTTFMNNSGEAIAPLAEKLGITPERVIVVHDELDIAPGLVRVKKGGGEGGHNGLKSTTAELGTKGYVRVRMGIGRPPQGMGVVDFVLAPFGGEDEQWLGGCIERTLEACSIVIGSGVERAQNIIHTAIK